MSQWIWKFGEYEIYHSLLCHTRRQHYGSVRPAMWKLYTPEPLVRFRKTVITQGGPVHIRACGDIFVCLQMSSDPGHKIELNGSRDFILPAGSVVITLTVHNCRTFPCVYLDGVVESDGSWIADDNSSDWRAVGTDPQFNDPDRTPETFPFSYEKISWVSRERVSDGVLFDFGKETYARTRICGISAEKESVSVRFGESREEALDPEWAVIRFKDRPVDGAVCYRPYAFRYIYVDDPEASAEADCEYLPLKQRGDFSSGDRLLENIWKTAAYTFHLNCREFLLDGIKRDGWVWSADAYQSFFVNRCLFCDPAIVRRTLIALAGKQPMKQHINTIMDYSFFWLISLWDYYEAYGDRQFPEQIFPEAEKIMRFCLERTDEDGFMRGRKGDWVFIDWCEMDREGAVCAEQILYAQALESYSRICRVLCRDDLGCGERAESLRQRIRERFFDPGKAVFIDSFESGKRHVTRHSNILACLFLPCSREEKEVIYERVIRNPDIAPITTPYFKFYENVLHCEMGQIRLMKETISAYYGGMLENGATSFYEEYDPSMKGAEHYAMYGHPFEKSLCHAWSASPVFLISRYLLGVKNTGIAYDSFELEPYCGGNESFCGTVPLPGGCVRVSVDPEKIEILTDLPGGTFVLGDMRRAIEPGKKMVFRPGESV